MHFKNHYVRRRFQLRISFKICRIKGWDVGMVFSPHSLVQSVWPSHELIRIQRSDVRVIDSRLSSLLEFTHAPDDPYIDELLFSNTLSRGQREM